MVGSLETCLVETLERRFYMPPHLLLKRTFLIKHNFWLRNKKTPYLEVATKRNKSNNRFAKFKIDSYRAAFVGWI